MLLQVCASATERAERVDAQGTMLQWCMAQTALALTASQPRLRRQHSGTDNLELTQLIPGLHRAPDATLHGMAQGAT
jgi:hypothetical protein